MATETGQPLRLVVFGTFDADNPRTRILIEGLRAHGDTVTLCHADIWQGMKDRSRIRGWRAPARLLLRWLGAITRLSAAYLRSPDHDLVLVCYPGHIDLWAARLLTAIRRKPLVWDAFISAYDTVITDRKMARPGSLIGRAAYALDWCACRLANLVILDTRAHADFFSRSFKVRRDKVADVPVGAERLFLAPAPVPAGTGGPFSVLFYGKFIPLHGLPVILEAAKLLAEEDIRFTVIGDGQVAPEVESWLARTPLPALTWHRWVDYDQLPVVIAEHHLGLGIFSAGDKAGRVVPNKIYQMLAAGLPVITRASPAMEPLAKVSDGTVILVPAENPAALAEAIRAARADHKAGRLGRPGPALRVGPDEIGTAAHALLGGWLERKR